MEVDPRAVRLVIEVTAAVYEAISSAGARGIPSGHLYAALMDRVSLEAYESCIAALVRTGLVQRANHVLTATAPSGK